MQVEGAYVCGYRAIEEDRAIAFSGSGILSLPSLAVALPWPCSL